MPRHQKSKLRGCKKCYQAQSDAQACGGAKGTESAYKSFYSSDNLNDSGAYCKPEMSLVISSSESDESHEESKEYKERNKYWKSESFRNIGEDDFTKSMMLLLWYLLNNYKKKHLSTKEEMLKVVTKRYESHFSEIFSKTSEKLEEAFSVEVREVNSISHTYNLISKLKLPNNGRVRPGKGYPKTGFLMCILGIIFFKGNCVLEEDIWRHLMKKRIYPGKKHCIYGEPRKLMTQDFVRLKYIEYRQVAGSHPPSYELLWGSQVHVENNKVQVLNYLAKLKKTTPRAISLFYEESLKDKNKEAQTRDAANPGTAAQASADPTGGFPSASTTSTCV